MTTSSRDDAGVLRGVGTSVEAWLTPTSPAVVGHGWGCWTTRGSVGDIGGDLRAALVDCICQSKAGEGKAARRLETSRSGQFAAIARARPARSTSRYAPLSHPALRYEMSTSRQAGMMASSSRSENS